ncbi:MAG: YgcG family protein [Patescibacteria group bacterium]
MNIFSAKKLLVHNARVIVLAMTLVVLPFAVIQAATYPSPQSFVTDAAQLLTSEEKQTLEATLSDFKQQTGDEIAVVTIPSLEGEPIEDYAVKLFEQWGIGQKEKDNGLLILVAKEDRAVRIEVGYGLEPVINDAKAGRIIRDIMAPAFQKEQYGAGLQSAVEAILGELKGEPTLVEETPSHNIKLNSQIVYLLIIFIIYLGSFLARSKRWWPGGVIGAVGGGVLGGMLGSVIIGAIALGLFGLGLDFILSRNYQARAKKGLPTTWWRSGGGFFGGGFGGGGGGFGGFGGGISGGGGASGKW